MSLIADALKAAQSQRDEQRRDRTLARQIVERPDRGDDDAWMRGASVRLYRPMGLVGAACGVTVLVALGFLALAPAVEAPAGVQAAQQGVSPPRAAVLPAAEERASADGVEPVGQPHALDDDAVAVERAAEPGPGDRSAPMEARAGNPPDGRTAGARTGVAGAVESPAAPVEAGAPAPRAPVVPEGAAPPRARAADAGDTRRYLREAAAAQARGEHGTALEAYQAALRLDPANAEIHNNLGLVQQSLGATRAARGSFRRALELRPGYGGAWNNLGVTLTALGETEEAVAALREAIRLEPENAGARVNLAQLHEARGQTSEARRLLQEALIHQPYLAEAHYSLARLLEAEGELPGAIRHFELFLQSGGDRFPELLPRVRQHVRQLEERRR